MKGVCLIWSRGRHFSPSLLHSISDWEAEISGILVMARCSGITSRGTTYWYQFFCFCYPASKVFRLGMRKFSDCSAYYHHKKKKNSLAML